MTLKLMILNGPNMNLLGQREPEIYGTTTLADVEKSCRAFAETLDAEATFHQSNYEGAIVDWVHEARTTTDALVINPAGLSFRSIPLLDALKTYDPPIVELHMSNIHARDELHRHSIISTVSDVVICGAGAYGYIVAMLTAARLVGKVPASFGDPLSVGPAGS